MTSDLDMTQLPEGLNRVMKNGLNGLEAYENVLNNLKKA